jgi:hypothetical protein
LRQDKDRRPVKLRKKLRRINRHFEASQRWWNPEYGAKAATA